MIPFFTLITSSPYINLPQGLVGWVGLLLWLGVILLLLWQWRSFNRPLSGNQYVMLAVLVLLTPLTSLFLGLHLESGPSLPPPGLPLTPVEPVIMLFACLPYLLAGGLLGPLAACLLAAFSGLLLAAWHTHNPFTPLELAILALLFSVAVRQRYRTLAFRLLRHPLLSAALLVLFYPILDLLITPFYARGLLVTRLDYALTNLRGEALAMGIQLLIAGLVAELIAYFIPGRWGDTAQLVPSPAERSLQTRFLVSMSPLAIILVLTLISGSWFIAGKAARSVLEAQMANATGVAADNIPYFLESGQNLISKLTTDTRLLSEKTSDLSQALKEDIKLVPFFNQLSVLDEEGEVIVSYPTSNFVGAQSPVAEQMGIQMALSGVPFQSFTIQPASDQTTAQVSFVTPILDADGKVQRVLIGRSDLATNPFIQPTLSSLSKLAGVDGEAMLLDENGRILAHSDPQRVMETYTGPTGTEPFLFDDTAPDGTRQLVYYQPAKGRPWSVILAIPAYRAQQITLTIALPLLAMITIVSLAAVIIVRVSLGVVTRSLQNLAEEAGRLAEGSLEQPVTVDSVDEVGQLGRAFEQMRVSLKGRLDELNQLLLVSQGIASSLEISEMVQPVLQSALAMGNDSARVVLTPTVVPELDGDSSTPISFGLGESQAAYGNLDEQILALTRQHDRLVLPNLNRPRLISFTPGAPHPESLMAVALKHENLYYGTLWVAYDQPHVFSEEEVRFLVTLGGQAALAAANARLFMNAEIGRKRLESILASSPDPMLVTDQRDRLLLANPAAWQVLGMGMETGEGQPIQQVISEQGLVDLLRSSSAEKQSREIMVPGGRVFMATATPVLAESQRVGRVCVLRDITHFKELDALKSEFVSTVSHDLRSPLTLMRGYATMLEMVGQLNEQQTSYVRKIIGGVESMSRLVNNLLDLGRIEAGVGLQLEMIPVHDVVERVVSALQLQAAQKRIQLSMEIPQHTIPLIEADQALLQQALHNLVENAIKYTRPEGKVMVRVQAQPTGLIFQVIDNGIGISPMDLPRLFEKFYRGAQQAARDQRGTGLGLAIVKSIAERHGGRVIVESQLGKGSVFSLAIPFSQVKPETRN